MENQDTEYKSGDQIAVGEVGVGQVGQVTSGQVFGGFNKNTLIQQLLNVNPKHLHLHFS